MNLIRIIWFFLGARVGEIIFSGYYISHIVRGALITYTNLHTDLATVLAFVIIAIFVLIINIWLNYEFTDGKDKKIYYAVLISLHIVMMLLIGFEFLYLHYDPVNFGASVFVYWFFEGGYHLYKSYKSKK